MRARVSRSDRGGVEDVRGEDGVLGVGLDGVGLGVAFGVEDGEFQVGEGCGEAGFAVGEEAGGDVGVGVFDDCVAWGARALEGLLG